MYKTWSCPKCSKDIQIPLQIDTSIITCNCGYTSNERIINPQITFITPKNLWVIIHEYLATQIKNNYWNVEEVLDYYNGYWYAMIPSCCLENFNKILENHPIDWSTAETAFYSFWFIHNQVSLLHSNKPTITYNKCKELYLDPSLPEKTQCMAARYNTNLDNPTL